MKVASSGNARNGSTLLFKTLRIFSLLVRYQRHERFEAGDLAKDAEIRKETK